jgi:hypothetical protein
MSSGLEKDGAEEEEEEEEEEKSSPNPAVTREVGRNFGLESGRVQIT